VTNPKGTWGESAVVKAILPYFPQAKRIRLNGAEDRGDIDCGDDTDFVIEVKAGKQTDTISDLKLAKWLDETEAERANAKKAFGFLVTQRRGVGAPRALQWWAWVDMSDLAAWLGQDYVPDLRHPVRMELGKLLELLEQRGYTRGVARAA
jgi:hypothetical protein